MDVLLPGTVISTKQGLVRHYGVISDKFDANGTWVISNSKKAGKVVEEPIAKFTEGGEFQSHGYPGNLTTGQVVGSARSRLGMPYRLADSNYEHFVREVHGLKPERPQFKGLLLASGLAVLVAGGFYLMRKSA